MEIRDQILAAGLKYPANWDEMSSSEKDLWEDNALEYLSRREQRENGF